MHLAAHPMVVKQMLLIQPPILIIQSLFIHTQIRYFFEIQSSYLNAYNTIMH